VFFQTDVLEEFKKAGIERQYHDGETIFLDQEPSTGMYLILKGEVSIMKRQADGTNKHITTISTGETLGEVSLLLEKPHTATVVAKTEVEALLLTQSRLRLLKQDDPALALRLYEILATTVARHLYERPWG